MDILNNFSTILNQNIFIAILASIFAGLLSSFSPCTLSTLPLIIGYIVDENVGDKNKNKRWMYGIYFSLGIILTFTTIGVISALLGKGLRIFSNVWYIILAVILIISALQLMGVFNKGDSCRRPKFKKGVIGAFFLGILGGFMASPCSTPILIIIVSFIAQGQNLLLGIILMLCYSIGFCIVIIFASMSIEAINKLALSDKYKKVGNILRNIFAVITIAFALYLLYIAF